MVYDNTNTPAVQDDSNAVPATEFVGDPYASYGAAAAAGGTPFLKFDRGSFKFGMDDDELPLGTRLVANMAEAQIGHFKWRNSEVVDEAMVRLADGIRPASREDLGDTDESTWEKGAQGNPINPWSFTNTVPLKDPASEAEFVFTTSSKGGIKAVGKLCMQYGGERLQNAGKLPVIEIGASSYRHKVYGEVHFPTFRIVEWRSEAELIGGTDSATAAVDDLNDDPPF